MIQELNSYEIDTHSIVVNQLLFPKQDNPCEQCNARRKMQKKYLDQIEELYDEFNVVKMPLLVEEVRGKDKLEKWVFHTDTRSSILTVIPDSVKCSSSLSSHRSRPVPPSNVIAKRLGLRASSPFDTASRPNIDYFLLPIFHRLSPLFVHVLRYHVVLQFRVLSPHITTQVALRSFVLLAPSPDLSQRVEMKRSID
jgi:hypothetical protein